MSSNSSARADENSVRAGEKIAVCWPNSRVYVGTIGTRTKRARTGSPLVHRNVRRIKWEDSTTSEFDLAPEKLRPYPDLLSPGEWCSVSGLWRKSGAGCVPHTLRADKRWDPQNHCSFQRSFFSIRPSHPDGRTHADHYAHADASLTKLKREGAEQAIEERREQDEKKSEDVDLHQQAPLHDGRRSARSKRERSWYVAESSTEEWRRKRGRN